MRMNNPIRKALAVLVIFTLLISGMVTGPIALAKIKLNRKQVTIAVGSSVQLKLKGTKKKPKWSTSDDSIVDVSNKGKILGIHPGKAVVTAKLKKKNYHCVVTVKNADDVSTPTSAPVTEPTPVPGTTSDPITMAPVATPVPDMTTAPTVTTAPSAAMPESYSVTSSDGKGMTVKPNFTSTIYHRDVKDASTGIKVRIPSIEGYSGSNLKLSSAKKGDEGYVTTKFEIYKNDSMSFLTSYVSDLEAKGFTKKYSGKNIYCFDYTGSESITSGTVEFAGSKYDMEILYKSESNMSWISVDHSPEIGFVTGDAVRDYGTIETATNRSIDGSGKTCYKINGWGEANNELSVYFSPDRYKEGDIVTAEDFKTQKNAGSTAALCWILAESHMISGDGTWDSVGPEQLRSAAVKIIKRTDDYEIVHSQVVYCRGEVDYVIESLCYGTAAATTSGGGGGGGGGGLSPLPIPSGVTICALCRGTGATTCHNCGGDGLIVCPTCRGLGYSTAYGQKVTCTQCYGKKQISCDKCYGKGQVTCTGCHGRGYV